MRLTPRMLFLAGAALVSVGVVADTIPTIKIPDSYFLGQSPTAKNKPASAGLETAAAVNGSLYAVIAPTYNGAGGASSYIRLFNGGSAAANFSVTVIGSPSGTTLGTANISIPVRASIQYALNGTSPPGILQLANAAALPTGDTGYSLYVQSTEPTAGYAHVVYNSVNTFFENVSMCSNLLNQSVKSVVNSAVLTNIHTSLFASNYPATVTIHNYWNAQISYRATVVDAATGTIKGQFNIPIAANASYSAPWSFFEQSVGWTPTAAELHANLVITDPAGVAPAVVLGQTITNSNFAGGPAAVNMSTVCAVNAAVVASSGGGSGGGGISY